MAGNVAYIPYTAFLMIGMIVSVILIVKFKSKKTTKRFLTITLPLFILVLVYFWNLDFNNYVKSYLFSSHAYECEYAEELEELSIPLPDRTVLKGRDDFCSPLYLTYIDDEDFTAFYQNELKKLKNSGQIEEYSHLEVVAEDGVKQKGYLIQLPSGSKIELVLYQYENFDDWLISVDYQQKSKSS